MTNTTQTPAPISAPAVRVTIDDVRTAIGGTDPNQTNASKVRAMLGGRGSFETIQKHLNTLRTELAAATAPPVSASTVPALPTDAAQQMWLAAWTAAQVQTLARSEKLAAERDAALLSLQTMSQDVEGLVATVDEQTTALDQAAVTVAKIQAAHLADLDNAEIEMSAAATDRDNIVQELERANSKLTKTYADAKHAAEIAEAGRDLMRQELARLTDQVGELKAALYRRVDTVPVVPADPHSPPPSSFPAGQ